MLCEKPFASNATEAAEMVATAERTGRVLVEAYHWRYHPVADRMLDLARAIGPLEELETRFSISIPSENIRYDLALAGGSFMDLGCYCMHIARTIAGGTRVISATAVEGPKGIDLSMETNLKFGDSLDAVVSCSMIGETSWPESMFVRARGRGGQLEVLNPMAPQWGHRIQAELADGTTVDEVIDAAGTSYDYQLRAFAVPRRARRSPSLAGPTRLPPWPRSTTFTRLRDWASGGEAAAPHFCRQASRGRPLGVSSLRVLRYALSPGQRQHLADAGR